MALRTLTLKDLTIDDERSFRHVGIYETLKDVLLRDAVSFRVPEAGSRAATWDRVVFLNLTFWGTNEPADVLADEHIPADVVAHVAWHHLARKALGPSSSTADGLFLGESIASAFDLYLVGRLLGHSPNAEFLETQVPALAAAAEAAGLPSRHFEALLGTIVEDPERAFEDLRELLFDATTSLVGASGVDDAVERLGQFDGHRFSPLLHHYEISNWVLYARAYAARGLEPDPRVRQIDTQLRSAGGTPLVGLEWLEKNWIQAVAQSQERV